MSELGALLTLEYGVALPETRRTGFGYPVFGSNGEVGRHQAFLVQGPGIVVGRKGSVGKVTWSEESFWPIDTSYWVDCSPDERRWLFWILSWLPLHRLDTSTGVPGLNRNDVYGLRIFRPDRSERQAITRILDAVDVAIQQIEAIIAKLKVVKRGLLHDLLTRGIDANGELRPPHSEAPHLYDASALGWIPKGWTPDILGRWLLGKPSNGYSPPEAPRWTGVQMLGLGCLTPEGFSPLQLKLAPANDKRLASAMLTPGDLLMSRSNTRALVGMVGIFEDVGTPCTYPDLMMRLRPASGTDAEFLQYVLQSAAVRRQIEAHASGTSGSMVKISGRTVSNLVLAMPPRDEQEAICAHAAASAARIAAESEKIAQLRSVKAGLMDDLLTGRVRISSLLTRTEQPALQAVA